MKKLRSGYTTGACAAAAAKAAAEVLFGKSRVDEIDIPFPGGERVIFTIVDCGFMPPGQERAFASVIKDAGDDPDVTNRAEITAQVSYAADSDQEEDGVRIIGGEGVGVITKPGLALPIGSAAINPVPLKMIRQAVGEVAEQFSLPKTVRLCVKVSVPQGVELAKKTLNKRLGIVGGVSILGTTGIVRPVSADAWTATIIAAMDVAEAAGNTEIVLSTGRTSEAALERTGNFHDEALIMMGDYLEFALNEAGNHSFSKIHIAGMWAKILKAAMRVPQTHVRFGMLEATEAVAFIQSLPHGKEVTYLEGVNTAREIYERLMDRNEVNVVRAVCMAAKEYHQEISGLSANVYLVHPSGKIVMTI